MSLEEIHARLRRLGSGEKAAVLGRFFKTGPGEYGEGDQFYGIAVPELRRLAREYETLTTDEVKGLLKSEFHEARLLALLVLMRAYAKADEAGKNRIYQFYLGHTRFINNWDLVDATAPHIVGSYLADKSRAPLYALARSASLWERRISIIATAHFIRQQDFRDTLTIAEILLRDGEDLIHKAVGWMLREVGKRDPQAERLFLKDHYRSMPRTMLRYAIEKFPEDERRQYLQGVI